MRSGGRFPQISGFILFYKGADALNIKIFKQIIECRLLREAVWTHDLVEPLALRPASVLVEPDSLGVIVVDLALAHGDYGTAS